MLSNPAEVTAIVTILDDDGVNKPAAASLAIGFEVKRLAFTWNAAARATSYKFMQRQDANADFVQVGTDLASTVTSKKIDIPTHLNNWAPTVPQYRVDACNDGGCTPSNVTAPVRVASALTTGYVKPFDTAANARFGTSSAVSGDGKTFAIGAPFTDAEAGSVYVYTAQTTGNAFTSHPVKIVPPSAQDMRFGFALALSEDGNTLAVGAPHDSHRQSGVGTYPARPTRPHLDQAPCSSTQGSAAPGLPCRCMSKRAMSMQAMSSALRWR